MQNLQETKGERRELCQSFGGSQVDIGPGQEACINHELGHIVQQRMGMVKATGKIGGRLVNTNQSLEEDATRHGTV